VMANLSVLKGPEEDSTDPSAWAAMHPVKQFCLPVIHPAPPTVPPTLPVAWTTVRACDKRSVPRDLDQDSLPPLEDPSEQNAFGPLQDVEADELDDWTMEPPLKEQTVEDTLENKRTLFEQHFRELIVEVSSPWNDDATHKARVNLSPMPVDETPAAAIVDLIPQACPNVDLDTDEDDEKDAEEPAEVPARNPVAFGAFFCRLEADQADPSSNNQRRPIWRDPRCRPMRRRIRPQPRRQNRSRPPPQRTHSPLAPTKLFVEASTASPTRVALQEGSLSAEEHKLVKPGTPIADHEPQAFLTPESATRLPIPEPATRPPMPKPTPLNPTPAQTQPEPTPTTAIPSQPNPSPTVRLPPILGRSTRT
ncbi:MAG: hypothetical protein AAGJ35_14365, partial [Myxococcota bacterium]